MFPNAFDTLTVREEGGVLFVEITAPPMNLLGPELVRDLVALIVRAEADDTVQILVFTSGDPDYFISHVDLTRIAEYRAEAAKLVGEPSIALLFHRVSTSRLVTIAQIEGRVRGAGSEFVLACDIRFAARESAVFGQFEPAFGLLPGGGATQHLVRLMELVLHGGEGHPSGPRTFGRARALEVMLSADDYDAQLAERYGWINRALPADEIEDFVAALARRIAGFPGSGHVAVKDRVNAIALATTDDFRRDSDIFGEGVGEPEAQRRIQVAMQRGLQTREAELTLSSLLGKLVEDRPRRTSPGQTHPPDCHRGGIMDFPAQFTTLEKRTSDARSAVKAAATETREQLQSRLDQAQADMDLAKSEAHQKTEEAKAEAQSKWSQIKADRRAKMDELKAKIEKRNRQQDAKLAEEEAQWAEDDAAYAIDRANWAVDDARLSVLDALDARVNADQLAKAAADSS